jgi:hypothetical protein
MSVTKLQSHGVAQQSQLPLSRKCDSTTPTSPLRVHRSGPQGSSPSDTLGPAGGCLSPERDITTTPSVSLPVVPFLCSAYFVATIFPSRKRGFCGFLVLSMFELRSVARGSCAHSARTNCELFQRTNDEPWPARSLSTKRSTKYTSHPEIFAQCSAFCNLSCHTIHAHACICTRQDASWSHRKPLS